MITFDNTYARLPDYFYQKIEPARVPDPKMVIANGDLADALGIDTQWLNSAQGLAMLSGNCVQEGSEPLAQVYAGHQFGGWVPMLGDGRAVLLGEILGADDRRYDIQLKGSGRTQFSRRGDGKATLGSCIREYLVSEAMHALGIPSTRALAVVATGENIPRHEIHPGGIFVRVASSHLRVGTFQFFHGLQDQDGIKNLADYAIDRHYPHLLEKEHPYVGLLEEVATRQAKLIAKWMQVGFIHGVMNTDNTAISGETIDFGPCALMENFHPDTVFSSIDVHGRYAWSNQPVIGEWNLARFAETIASLIDEDFDVAKPQIEKVLDLYWDVLQSAYLSGFCEKLGVHSQLPAAKQFVASSLKFMSNQQVDFTMFFRCLTRLAAGDINDRDFIEQLRLGDQAKGWLESWRAGSVNSGEEQIARMQACNPVLIPRNHRVEQAIQAAESGNYELLFRYAEAWKKPYSESTSDADLEQPAKPHERVTETFCGT